MFTFGVWRNLLYSSRFQAPASKINKNGACSKYNLMFVQLCSMTCIGMFVRFDQLIPIINIKNFVLIILQRLYTFHIFTNLIAFYACCYVNWAMWSCYQTMQQNLQIFKCSKISWWNLFHVHTFATYVTRCNTQIDSYWIQILRFVPFSNLICCYILPFSFFLDRELWCEWQLRCEWQ